MIHDIIEERRQLSDWLAEDCSFSSTRTGGISEVRVGIGRATSELHSRETVLLLLREMFGGRLSGDMKAEKICTQKKTAK